VQSFSDWRCRPGIVGVGVFFHIFFMWMMSRADIRRPAVVASGSWGREWTLNFFQL